MHILHFLPVLTNQAAKARRLFENGQCALGDVIELNYEISRGGTSLKA
jgi:hypothetical protein